MYGVGVWSTLVVIGILCFAAAPEPPVPFKTLETGGQSGIETKREVAIKTAGQWKALWNEHAPGSAPPAVDFSKSMVVGVFLGTRTTGGHAVEITRIASDGRTLDVTYRERRPAARDIVTQVITAPFHLVTIERFAGNVRFTSAR